MQHQQTNLNHLEANPLGQSPSYAFYIFSITLLSSKKAGSTRLLVLHVSCHLMFVKRNIRCLTLCSTCIYLLTEFMGVTSTVAFNTEASDDKGSDSLEMCIIERDRLEGGLLKSMEQSLILPSHLNG